MLDFMVEAQLGIGFNKLENAAVALDRGQHILYSSRSKWRNEKLYFRHWLFFWQFRLGEVRVRGWSEDCGGFCRTVKLNKKQHRIVSFS